MKRVVGAVALVIAFVGAEGQGSLGNNDSSGSYSIIERGPHYKTWARTVAETTPFGEVVMRTNIIQELASGMNYRGANGEWLETQESFSILPDGSGAVALQGPYQVFAPADIYEGVIAITLPSGVVIHTRPVAISYFDGTNNLLIAELTNSIGQLSPDGRQVIWPSAFTDFKADLVASYHRGSFECDLVFREQPPAPETLGLSENCRLQLLTETFDTPDPAADIQTTSVADANTVTFGQDDGTNSVGASDNGDAVTLHFRGMSMPSGKAFSIGSEGNGTNSFRSVKRGSTTRSVSSCWKTCPIRRLNLSWASLRRGWEWLISQSCWLKGGICLRRGAGSQPRDLRKRARQSWNWLKPRC